MILQKRKETIMRVRILTFNVWNQEGDPRSIEFINRELRWLDPDLVSLPEVVRTPERNQLAELLNGTALYGAHQLQVMAYTPPWSERYGGDFIKCLTNLLVCR